MPDTSIEPTETVCIGHDGVPVDGGGTAADTTVIPGLLLEPSTASYGNGYTAASANYGDSNTDEGALFICELEAISSNSNVTTAWNKTTAYAAGNPIIPIQCVVNNTYWVKGSSVTASKGDKLYVAGSGLVAAQTAHTATSLPHHTFVLEKAVSAATWMKATYIGITPMFTA